MANSSIIEVAKNKIIREFIKDEKIVEAIDSAIVPRDCPEELINTHIFDYGQNPNTVTTAKTFLTIQVHIPYTREMERASTITYVKPTVEICIISHESHMVVNNVPKVKSNRNDYLSRLIDEKMNGASGFGIGKLVCISNVEGNVQQNYSYRKITFQCVDLNDSLCDLDE